MIDVKVISKPKNTSSVSGGSGGSGGYAAGVTVEEAKHALKADKAEKSTYAEQSAEATHAVTADKANYASLAGGLSEDSDIYDKFIRKDIDDTAHGIVTFQQGVKFGDDTSNLSIDKEGNAKLNEYRTASFESGLYGKGALIDSKGAAEVQSLFAREFISAPKFVFNEIEVSKAERWLTNGCGTIQEVDTENQIITLKLEENDYGAVEVGDICRGIYADLGDTYGSSNNVEGTADDCNFLVRKGFFTTYFWIDEIITSKAGECRFHYQKRTTSTPDPCAFMDFAQYGSFTNEARQGSYYESSKGYPYQEVLAGVNTWQIQSANRTMRTGYLGNLTITHTDGTTEELKGFGLYAQNNIYLGGGIANISDLIDLDALKKKVASYSVTLDRYEATITVDDQGNVVGGVYVTDDEETVQQYIFSTAVFVRKGEDILLEQDADKDLEEGYFRIYAVGQGCSVKVMNSTVFVTALDNIRDGVYHESESDTYDYDAMRAVTAARVLITVDCEGIGSRVVSFPIRIQHESSPVITCDLDNEMASVVWNEKTKKYVGFPITCKASLYYASEPWEIKTCAHVGTLPTGLKMAIEIVSDTTSDDYGKAIITIDTEEQSTDSLLQTYEIPIEVTGKYAGVNYSYEKSITIHKSADACIYEVLPSVDNIIVDKFEAMSTGEVTCEVWATSSDDNRYPVTDLGDMVLKYGIDKEPSIAIAIGDGITLTSSNKYLVFALYDAKGNILDRESVPVIIYGQDGKGIEYVFCRTANDTAPTISTPSDWETNTSYQADDYVPSGWTDDPTGVDEQYPFEWVSIRKSVNGVWQAFGDVAQYSHYGKDAAIVECDDEIVTIPTNADGKTLTSFSESIGFRLYVDNEACTSVAISKASGSLPGGCTISGATLTVSYSADYILGSTSYTARIKVTGKHGDATYTQYKTVKIVPNVTGEDGDGYEYVYYLSSSSSAPSTPSRSSSGSLTSGWSEDVVSPTVSYQYVYVAWRNGKVGETGVTFDGVKLWNRYPKSVSRTLTYYARSSSGDSYPTSGWSTSKPTLTDAYPWMWMYIYTEYTDGTSDYSGYTTCGYKGKDGAKGDDGSRGTRGALIRTWYYDNLSGSHTFLQGADSEDYNDWVYYNGYWYRCIKTTSESSTKPDVTDTDYWAYVGKMDALATTLLLADNARINMAASQEVNILDSSDNVYATLRTGDYPLWIGATSADNAAFKVDSKGVITSQGGIFNEVTVNGTIRNPFTKFTSAVDVEMTDNVVAVSGYSWGYTSKLPWTTDQSGRRVVICTAFWGSSWAEGTDTYYAPSGKYFFEDGLLKKSITLSREMVELMGYGDSDTFFGWIVFRRIDIGTDYRYGRCKKVLAEGHAVISYNSSSKVWKRNLYYTTFDGSTITLTRNGVGNYRLTISCATGTGNGTGAWVTQTNHLFVQVTGEGYLYNGTSIETGNPVRLAVTSKSVSGTTIYIDIICADDNSANDAQGFAFQISNLNDSNNLQTFSA